MFTVDESQLNGDTRANHVYAEIKRAIITMELAPGSVIQEEALARQLGVSRTPVREALRRLGQEGLVLALPKKGLLVADISTNDILEIFEVRMRLEPHAARLAALHMPAEEIDHLRELHTPPGGSGRGFHEGYRQLHSSIARFCGNSRMRRTLDSLMNETARILTLGGPEERVRQHELHLEIIDALERRDPEAVEQAMQKHLLDFRNTFVSFLLTDTGGGRMELARHGAWPGGDRAAADLQDNGERLSR